MRRGVLCVGIVVFILGLFLIVLSPYREWVLNREEMGGLDVLLPPDIQAVQEIDLWKKDVTLGQMIRFLGNYTVQGGSISLFVYDEENYQKSKSDLSFNRIFTRLNRSYGKWECPIPGMGKYFVVFENIESKIIHLVCRTYLEVRELVTKFDLTLYGYGFMLTGVLVASYGWFTDKKKEYRRVSIPVLA